jgi:hypothetical protein
VADEFSNRLEFCGAARVPTFGFDVDDLSRRFAHCGTVFFAIRNGAGAGYVLALLFIGHLRLL